jgi:hypothetical protein
MAPIEDLMSADVCIINTVQELLNSVQFVAALNSLGFSPFAQRIQGGNE